MSKIALTPNTSGTGTLTLAAPNTNTDRTLTLPDATTTLVGTDATQTLSNKTFSGTTTAPIINSGNSATDLALLAGTLFNINGASIALRGSTAGYNTYGMEFYTGGTERMRIDASGNVSITQSAGKYTIDTSGGATGVANGGTVDFPSASGMLIVNNHSSGAVTIYLCGGGATAVIGSVGTQVGTFAYVAGITGYRWTNNFGNAAVFGFFFVRTRNTA